MRITPNASRTGAISGSCGERSGSAVADRRLLFFGDSLVAGVGDPTGAGWVGRVVAASFASGLPLTAYNLGIRGETSEQIASRWLVEALPRLLAGADCRIVLSFGANDTSIEHDQVRVDTDRSSGVLVTILQEAETIGLPTFVLGPAPVDDPEQNRRIHSLSVSFAEVCTERGVPFVSVIEPLLASPVWMKQVADGDGAHPGAGGYDALAHLVLAGGWLDWLCGEAR
jgi:acyl-CoA thioesterase I